MRAVVTVINDEGEVVEKDKIIMPYEEYITNNPKDIAPIKTTIFRFGINEALNQHEKVGKYV